VASFSRLVWLAYLAFVLACSAAQDPVGELEGQWAETPAPATGARRIFRFRASAEAAAIEVLAPKVTCSYARITRIGSRVSFTRVAADGRSEGRTDELVITVVDASTFRLRLAAEPAEAERTFEREGGAPAGDICTLEGLSVPE